MELTSIQLKVISCKGLKSFNFFQKPRIYVVGSIAIDGDGKKTKKQQQQKTPMYRKGEGSLEWNHEMRFDLDRSTETDCLFLEFDLVCEGLFGEKTIGEVRVPVKDLMEQYGGDVRFITYQVTSTDGKPNGVFYFSYKLNGKVKIQNEFLPYPAVSPSPDVSFPATAPPAEHVGYYPPPPPLVEHVWYYHPPPLPPPAENVGCCYLPPPPPPLIYFTGPEAYGSQPVDFGHALYGMNGYSAVGQYQPSNYDTWRA